MYGSTRSDLCMPRHRQEGRRKVKGAPIGIIPNYRKLTIDVNTEAMTYILTGTGTLSPLSRVQHSAESKGMGLPSWVVDMSAPRSTSLLRIQKFSVEEDRAPFDASRRISKGFIISGYTLTVHIYKHATVTHIGDSRDEICKFNTMEKTAQLVLARSELPSAQGLLIDDVGKTMLCDVLSPRRRRYSDNDLRAGFTWFVKCVWYGLSSYVNGPNLANGIRSKTKWPELLAERDDTGTIPSPKAVIASFRESGHERGSQRAEALIFEQLFDRSMAGRRLFLLDAGELGIGSDDILPRDTLCIIADGARTPFALRKASVATVNTWTLVGEAYVSGIMYGEAVDRAEKNDESWEEALHYLRERNEAVRVYFPRNARIVLKLRQRLSSPRPADSNLPNEFPSRT